jgi:hypothetical protein
MATPIKIGMVGLDTSHCPAFTGIFNDPNNTHHVPGGRVVGAYPGGSDAFALSRDRVAGFTQQLNDQFGVTLYESIPALVEDVDAILLESADGRQHLEQFREMAVGKPVFVDKPLATTTVDARQIIKLARDTGTPLMSCSSLRYAKGIADLVERDAQVIACEAFGPAVLLEDFPGLFWYGIHSAEILFSMLGPGCRSVRCIEHPATDIVLGEWEDSRTGVLRGTRFEGGTFGCVVHTPAGATCGIAASTPPYYALMLQEVMTFFKTGVSPIDIRQTWDIVAFLEAAEKSRALAGDPVVTARL